MIPVLHLLYLGRLRLDDGARQLLDLWTVGGLPGVTISPPWVLGADGMGVVAETSADVTSVRVGDRVMLNPGLSCRECEYCLKGEQPLCVRFRLLGEHAPGTLAEQIAVPGTNV